jgi:hypothetical protein
MATLTHAYQRSTDARTQSTFGDTRERTYGEMT